MRVLLFFFLLQAWVIQAQPLIRHNLYPFNSNFANPAATGMSGCLEFAVTDMHQWLGIPNAPNVQSFSVQKGIPFLKNKKNGLGLNLVRDSNGPMRNMGGEFLYAFHSQVGRNRTTWLSLGLSGFIEERRLDESGFSPIFDPHITGGMVSEITYNASAGASLYNEKFFGGIAVYNLIPVKTTLDMGYGTESYFVSLQGGYLFTFESSPVALLTSVQASIGHTAYQFDVNNKLLLKNNIWAGLTFRKYLGQFETAGQNALLFLGYSWNQWNITYCYNFDINGTQFHHYGTHQLGLGYKICRKDISCPTYR